METQIPNRPRTDTSKAFDYVIPYLTDPRDRDAVSLVCWRFYQIDAQSRKKVTIAMCYSATPQQLLRRFPFLESVKLKGKPRAAMFNLISDDWGGYATPWVEEFAKTSTCLKSLHLRRMIVTDSDLKRLAEARGNTLRVLKLDKCSGFSTDGLLHITRCCRNIRVLFLEESTIMDNDGEWLHELALHNTVLETLNFYSTYLSNIRIEDLETIATKCGSLVSLKISDQEILDLFGFFRAAAALEEFGGGCISKEHENYSSVTFPTRLCSLGLSYLGKNELPIVFPSASILRKLDLMYALLDEEDHCELIRRCPNLEVLETRNVIGDKGLEVLAYSCKRLSRLRIERGADDVEMEDEGGVVSQIGLIALAQGCFDLEYLAVHVTDITNEALACIGTHLNCLQDFRLVLLARQEIITDFPLDNGVQALLRGCSKLRRFALYLREGGLTDVGLGYIGKYCPNVKWILLGHVGESDDGLIEFSKGCPSLQKLEMRGCCFSEHALAISVLQLNSLRYLWVQGYGATETGRDLLSMARPFWNVELIRPQEVPDDGGAVGGMQPAQILAYYSLAGKRTDFPSTVVPL